MLGLLGGSRQHCQMSERLDRHNDGSAHDHVPVVAELALLRDRPAAARRRPSAEPKIRRLWSPLPPCGLESRATPGTVESDAVSSPG